MAPQEVLFDIIRKATQAPSGDNSQPWRFVWSEKHQIFSLYNLPDNDNPVFNYKQRGSLIAHGALLENIRLLAGVERLQAHIDLFPELANEHLVAHIHFTDSTAPASPLAQYVAQRHTNRKPYRTEPLTEAEREALLAAPKNERVTLNIEQTDTTKNTLAQAVSTAERIMLQFKPLHDAFFRMVRWSPDQEREKGGGLYVKTMELLPPQRVIFKLYSFWPIARILNKLGMPTFIANENAKIYKQASAFILFTGTEQTSADYIHLGSSLQRVWLTATQLGLSMQPVAGVLYLYQRMADESTVAALTPAQRQLITRAVEDIASSFHAHIHTLRMLVRVGKGDQPSARAQKQRPIIEIE